MGEVLSQSEIDNLLAQLSSGELDMEQMQEPKEKQVKDYDFKRPAKFSKDGCYRPICRFICARMYRLR